MLSGSPSRVNGDEIKFPTGKPRPERQVSRHRRFSVLAKLLAPFCSSGTDRGYALHNQAIMQRV
jgi:hypothetical protein